MLCVFLLQIFCCCEFIVNTKTTDSSIWNDLLCVEGDIKLYSVIQSVIFLQDWGLLLASVTCCTSNMLLLMVMLMLMVVMMTTMVVVMVVYRYSRCESQSQCEWHSVSEPGLRECSVNAVISQGESISCCYCCWLSAVWKLVTCSSSEHHFFAKFLCVFMSAVS